MQTYYDCQPASSQPLFFSQLFFGGLKKGKVDFECFDFYGRFLSSVANTKPTIAIAMMMATVEMAKYISVGGKTVTGYGDAVGPEALTVKNVSSYDA